MQPSFILILQPNSHEGAGASVNELKPLVTAARAAEELILAEFPNCVVDLVIRSAGDGSDIPSALLSERGNQDSSACHFS